MYGVQRKRAFENRPRLLAKKSLFVLAVSLVRVLPNCMGDSYERKQKVVPVKMYPKEIEALDVIAKLAGWDHRSTALREFMKIWIECGIIAIEKDSSLKAYGQLLKSMVRINRQMETITKNSKEHKKEMFHEHDLQVLKEALAI